MSAVRCKTENEEYIMVQGANLFLDYTNDRLKIANYENISEKSCKEVIQVAKEKGFGKVIANCVNKDLHYFKDTGFVIEGVINGFFKGEDAYCVSYFVDKRRSISRNKEEEEAILNKCMEQRNTHKHPTDNNFKVRGVTEEDIPQMIELFRAVFKTYPSPVFDAEYLKKVMNDKILFKVATENDKIISIASADMDKANLNAEITDCATYPEYRGKGLLSRLIESLEEDLKSKNFYTLYSLSRAINTGINMALKKQGYNYCGRLVNNCHICGGFEDMNIWVKPFKK